MGRNDEDWAVFWCSLLSPVLLGEIPEAQRERYFQALSRYIVEARYYVRENLDILVDSLLRAWGNHGASRELYVDNAKIYHAKALPLACTQLNIKLLHRPPRDAAPGGLIERFFQTCQTQFEAEVRVDNLFFAVDPKLRGDPVIVEYDPFSSLEEVRLYSPVDVYLGRGKRYQRQRGSHQQPAPAPPTGPITPHYLDILRAALDVRPR